MASDCNLTILAWYNKNNWSWEIRNW